MAADKRAAAARPPIRLNCIPRRPRAQWLNIFERFFGKLDDKAIRRGVFHSVPDLIAAIEEYLKANNQGPRAARLDRHHRVDL